MTEEISTDARSLKRDVMVKYAYELFYRNGFHATGVDTILEGTGISKRTLYKHFTTKEGLIVASIDYYHQRTYKAIAAYIEQTGSKNPVEKILRIFDFLSDVVNAGRLDGCFAMNAKTEYANKAKDIEAAYDDYVTAVLQLIETYLKDAGVSNSSTVALQVGMLFEGAIIRSKAAGNSRPVKAAKAAAKLICSQ